MNYKINLTLTLLLIFFSSLLAEENADPKHKVKIGDMAPDFQLYFPDGKTQLLSDLKGKVIMLQFTASWCSVCLKEMPFIEAEIWQKLKNNPDFVLIAIDFKESPEKIPPFLKAAKTTYPMALDTNGAIFELYAEKDAGVTRNIIIDKSGKIAFLTRLFAREEFDAMKTKIDELLKLKGK
jgi:peroxiredoxin